MHLELTPKPGTLGLKRQAIIWEYERGLLYRDGKFQRLLEAGRYEFWRWEEIRIAVVSLRQMSEVINSQAILTADKVEVRLSLIAQYRVTDPVMAINQVESYTDKLYQDLQLTLRDLVTAYEVDDLLAARAELSTQLLNDVAPTAARYGLDLQRLGIRDIVLPRTVRDVFLREVEADRQGRADLVKARHEVAAARARANTAKILSQNPDMARLQELDTLVELAGRNGSVVLLPNMADLFTSPRPTKSETDESAPSTS
ncbi:MAG TPA: slipin family protein [Anaerolineae bacterium]|nr:slipin family protein [Anaerolineae bacterium]